MKATLLLMEEHQYILRALEIIDRMAARTGQGERVDQSDLECVLLFLRFFADDHHQAKEESILFPALLNSSNPDQYALLCKMAFEHDQQRSLVEGIEDALCTRKGADFVYYAHRLANITRAHISDEDNVFFKHADNILPPEEDELVAQEIGNFDSPLRRRTQIRLLESLETLEMKYNGTSGIIGRAIYA